MRVMRAQLDGLPLVGRCLTIVDQNVRMLRSLNPTFGEIQALHDAVNAVQAEITELAAKIATLERLVADLRWPLVAQAQQPVLPVIGFLSSRVRTLLLQILRLQAEAPLKKLGSSSRRSKARWAGRRN
jgi:hypothetical protein